jgi:hypothetical protein
MTTDERLMTLEREVANMKRLRDRRLLAVAGRFAKKCFLKLEEKWERVECHPYMVRHPRLPKLLGTTLTLGLPLCLLGLLMTIGAWIHYENPELADMRHELIQGQVDLGVPESVEGDTCGDQEQEFWYHLNKRQQQACVDLHNLTVDQSDAKRVETLRGVAESSTPGMLLILAEHTRRHEAKWWQDTAYSARMKAQKDRFASYYYRLIDDHEDLKTDLYQANRFYCELKERATHRKSGGDQWELLHDLRNSILYLWEPAYDWGPAD